MSDHNQVFFAAACETVFLGPTNHRGCRVRAKHLNTGKRVIVTWDHALGALENHTLAARKVLDAEHLLVCSVDGGGYVFMKADGHI
jgi:hypothetical protein